MLADDLTYILKYGNFQLNKQKCSNYNKMNVAFKTHAMTIFIIQFTIILQVYQNTELIGLFHACEAL